MYTIYINRSKAIEEFPKIVEKWEKTINDLGIDYTINDIEGKDINDDSLEDTIKKELDRNLSDEKEPEELIEENTITYFYIYGYSEDSEEEITKDQENVTSEMLYEDRLEYELTKVRVNLGVKIENFMIYDRMDYIPKTVIEIIEEITKVKMITESKYNNMSDEVIQSIPKVDNEKATIKVIDPDEEDYEVLESDEDELDIDEILDKISKQGMSSLTDDELNFLNDKSNKNE